MPGIFLLILIIVVAAIALGAAKTRETLNRSWGRIADRFGLTLTPAEWNRSPKLAGEVEGYPLIVDIHKRGSGQHKSAWTRFRLGIPSLNLGLELKEEGFLSQISKAFGGSDIEVGDAAFDNRLLIKGDDARAIRAFLDAERRTAIERFFVEHRGTVIDDQGITWAMRGRAGRALQLISVIDEMLLVARSLAPQDARPPKATAGSVGLAAAAALPATAAALPVEAAVLAADTAREDAASEAGLEARSEPEPVPEPGTEPGTQPAPESKPALGAAQFSEAVFAPGSLSYAAAQTFRERFQGQTVTWSGKLQAIEPYSFDFVFGAGGGIKAIVEVHRIDGVTTGKGSVEAIVQLPAGAGGLAAKPGERVSFTGTLTKVDGLERRVFVSDGRLEG